MKRILPLLTTTLLLVACGAPQEPSRVSSLEESQPQAPKTMNDRVLAAIADVGAKDAGLGYSLETQGQHTRSLVYGGEQIFTKGSRKSHCVGMTFQLLVMALNDYFRETADSRVWNMPASAMRWSPFKECWYINGECTSAGYAMKKYGIGTEFTDFKALKAGDFVQFWRTSGSGHSVVFLNFIDGNDKIVSAYPETMIGFEYFSSQGSTNGVSRMRAYFDGNCHEHANKDCRIIRSSVASGRVAEPADFRANTQFTFAQPLSPYNSSRLFR